MKPAISIAQLACFSFLLLFSYLAPNTATAQTWNAAGNGIDGFASTMIEYNGELYVGGNQQFGAFTGPRIGLWKWDGSQFDTLPGSHIFGTTMIVYDMAVFQGELYVTGSWSGISKIVKWDGSTFTPVPNTFVMPVSAMEVFNNELYAASRENGPGCILRWDGTQWHSVGTGLAANSTVNDMEVYANELYVAGTLNTTAGNSMNIARWNGTAWNSVGAGGVDGAIQSITKHNGELYIGGGQIRLAGGVPVFGITRWNGSNWSPVTTNRSHVSQYRDIRSYQGELYAAGNFLAIEGDTMRCISRYDGSDWTDLSGGVDSAFATADTILIPIGDSMITSLSDITAMYEFDGELFVSGIFEKIGGVQAHRIAKWSATLRAAEPSMDAPLCSIYPNPAIDHIRIASGFRSKQVQIQIHDMQGRLRISKVVNPEATLDVSALGSGIFILQCSDGKTQRLGKFVIQE